MGESIEDPDTWLGKGSLKDNVRIRKERIKDAMKAFFSLELARTTLTQEEKFRAALWVHAYQASWDILIAPSMLFTVLILYSVDVGPQGLARAGMAVFLLFLMGSLVVSAVARRAICRRLVKAHESSSYEDAKIW